MTSRSHEGLRFRAAKLAAAARALKQQSVVQAASCTLLFLTDDNRIKHPELIARSLPRGAGIILRDYHAPRREALARRMLSICQSRGLKLLIAADPALANQIGACGVHYPSWFTPKSRPAPEMLVTASCHSTDELVRAKTVGADLALLSPAFQSASHPDGRPIGPTKFRNMAARSPLPVVALGGITAQNAFLLQTPNTVGIAAIGAFSG